MNQSLPSARRVGRCPEIRAGGGAAGWAGRDARLRDVGRPGIGVAGALHGLATVAGVHKFVALVGTIHPSRHVSNAVVRHGLIAWTAPHYRRLLAAAAVFVSIPVGISTI